ncbi:Cardiolipin synthase, partial [termite gut metagenome]
MLKKYTFILLLFIVAVSNKAQVITSDSLVRCFLTQSGIPITDDNTVMLLKNGQEKFDDLFSVIEKAQHHIHLEYFNLRNDSIGTELFKLLTLKAEQGLEVRVLFDAFGNLSNNRPFKNKHLKALREKGIEIIRFDPVNFPYINHILHRDHRKIAIIDGKIGYTGGINVADYYIQGLPEIGDWHDAHIRIEGSAVKYMQEFFLSFWNKNARQNIGGEQYFPPPEQQAGKKVAIIDRTPKVTPKLIRHTYIRSIHSAQKSVQIINPYFLPIRSVKKELYGAIDRGIHVEILLSSKSDISFTPEASFYVVHKLMKRGAQIYLYNGGFHHSKIMMVDSAFSTVGSANLNSRSLCYDYENNAYIFD